MNARVSITRIVAASVTLVALVSSYWIYSEYSFARARLDLMEAGRVRATQITEAARQQFAATFRGADYLLQDVRLNLAGTPGDVVGYAAKALTLLPASAGARLAVYDGEGRLLESTDAQTMPANIGDRPFFKELKSAAGRDTLVIGEVERDAGGERWFVPLARPVPGDGGVDGVVLLALSPRFLSDELAQIVLGDRDVVGATHVPDGTYLARSSGIDRLLGKAVPPGRPYLAPGAPSRGNFTGAGADEPIERIYAWSRLPDLPVVVFIGLSTADLLAPLDAEIARHRRTTLLGTVALLCLGVPLIMLARRGMRQRRELMRQAVQYHALFDQNYSIKLVTDPSDGRILAANAAAVAFYGYSHQQLVNMKIADINCLPPDEIEQRMGEARAGRKHPFVFPHRLASGEIRTVEVFSGPVQFGGNLALYSIIHDVTDRFELERALRASELRYRTIFESVPAGIMLVDENGTIVAWNEMALSILRVDAKNLVDRSIAMYDRHGQEVAAAQRPSLRCLREDFHEELYAIRDEQGRNVWLNINGRQLNPGPDGERRGGVIIFSDITYAVQLEEALLISERVFEAAVEGIMVTDTEGRIIRVNPAFRDITGYSPEEVVGQRPDILAHGLHEPGFYRAILDSLASKGTWEGEITNRRKDGRLFFEQAAISVITRSDGRHAGYVALFSDITLRKRKEAETWRRANFDALTDLPNRTLLSDRINQALVQSRREERRVAILFIDLDEFKPVNDRWGHAAGDEILRMAAQRIAQTVRDEDTVARMGGDEFVVLMPVVASESAAVLVAERILEQLCMPFSIAAGEVSISASIGVASDQGGLLDAATLINRADIAMYRGKAGGRARVVLFVAEPQTAETEAAQTQPAAT